MRCEVLVEFFWGPEDGYCTFFRDLPKELQDLLPTPPHSVPRSDSEANEGGMLFRLKRCRLDWRVFEYTAGSVQMY